jgi:ATP-binding cassette subfamily B protein
MLLVPVPVKIAVDSVLGDEPMPGYLAPLVPDAWASTDAGLLLFAAALQVLVVLLVQLQQLASYGLRTRTGEALTQRIRDRLFAHAQRLSLLRHETKGSTDSVYRIQYDAMAVQKVTVEGLLTTVTATVTLLTTVAVIAALNWRLALVGLLVSPVLVVLTRGYRVRVRPRYRDVKDIESDAMRVVHEALSGLRVVKAFGQEDAELERFDRRARAGLSARVRLAWAEGWFGLLVNLVTAVGTAAVLLIGVRDVQRGVLSLGELLMVIAYLSALYGPLKTISRKAASVQTSLASAERVFEFLDEPVDVEQRAHCRPLVRSAGLVELDRVSLAYDGGPPVLSEVSLRVEPGMRVGVTGLTGAGKTSLVSLLVRFYDPTAGRILLDGVDLRDYCLADLRRQVAVALQDPVLFSTSIAENIRYARPDADLDEVVAAAEQADAHGFVSALPLGYDTPVGERGMRLSGGERQRISLARAFLKGGSILVLDEPTSSVDVRTEATILEAMRRLMEGRTTFLVTHRASALDVCDVRIELAGGRLTGALA